MVVLAEPDPSDMVYAIKKAIYMLPKIDPQDMHNRVSLLFKCSFLTHLVGKLVLFCFCLP
jgi:phosphatidylinositol glycan class A protein